MRRKTSDDLAGDWQGLGDSIQSRRYREVVRLLSQHATNGSLLDVGCGEAILSKYLPVDWLGSYTGVERSEVAARNSTFERACDKIIVSPLEDFETTTKFDAIIFNEVLYYLRDPLGALARFQRHLRRNAVFVISIFLKPQHVRAVRRLMTQIIAPRSSYSNIHCAQMVEEFARQQRYLVLERCDIPNPATGVPWRIYVMRPSY